ncbi:hypothetical protein BKA67DRAFT_533758 [Truncatella angustata]|uniref:Uncharacterized protein n=1 Tax=Truncatella angustata TaxID=152316 RepID=A0A9P8UUU1_9PEZI|nr:uncharacterized protein BKA67DRAFT_533758 [Truncatella angustata]KAH6658628.1 hypothetical protein BKA67DRAFT_533758 [Truncatella angustata]
MGGPTDDDIASPPPEDGVERTDVERIEGHEKNAEAVISSDQDSAEAHTGLNAVDNAVVPIDRVFVVTVAPSRTPPPNKRSEENYRTHHRYPIYRESPWMNPSSARRRIPRTQRLIYEPWAGIVSEQQVVAEVRGVFAGLGMLESKCKEVDTKDTMYPHGVMDFLEVMPDSTLVWLQRNGIDPAEVLFDAMTAWLDNMNEYVQEGGQQLSCPKVIANSAAVFNAVPLESAALKEANAQPANHASTDDALQTGCSVTVDTRDPGFCAVPIPALKEDSTSILIAKEYLPAFLVAQELWAEEVGSPDYDSLVSTTTRLIGQQGRKDVLVEGFHSTVGRALVDAVKEALKRADHNAAETARRQAEEKTKAEAKANRQAVARAKDTAISEPLLICKPFGLDTVQQKATKGESENDTFEIAPSHVAEERKPNKAVLTTEEAPGTCCYEHSAIQADSASDASPEKQPAIANTPQNTGAEGHAGGWIKRIGEWSYIAVRGGWMRSYNDEQYQALITLHRALLHEHYDFFFASQQHPSAPAALKYLAEEYSMEARLWQHVVHSLFEKFSHRLPTSLEYMKALALMSYTMFGLFEETVAASRLTWIEYQADVARLRMSIEDDALERLRWKEISKELLIRAHEYKENYAIGRFYHHIAALSQPDYLLQFFYYLKSLNVKQPFFDTHSSLLTLIGIFVTPSNKESTIEAQHLSQDETNLFTAVSCLILIAESPSLLAKYGYHGQKVTHLRTFDEALAKIAGLPDHTTGHPSVVECIAQRRFTCPGEVVAQRSARAERYTVRPSPELALMLCQLLFLDPYYGDEQCLVTTAWAQDLAESRWSADIAVHNQGDGDFTVVDRAASLLGVVVTSVLTQPDTQDLKFWEFVHVLLIFMRALQARPKLKARCGYAFHPELLAPLLNVLLRHFEKKGGSDWKSIFQPEFPVMFSTLNKQDQPGDYGRSNRYADWEVYVLEQREKAKRLETEAPTAATVPDVETSVATVITQHRNELEINAKKVGTDSANTDSAETKFGQTTKKELKIEVPPHKHVVSKVSLGNEGCSGERLYTCPLPEDFVIRGFSFARSTPCPPQPEESPSEEQLKKQTAREKWMKEGLARRTLTQTRLNNRNRKQQQKKWKRAEREAAKCSEADRENALAETTKDTISASEPASEVSIDVFEATDLALLNTKDITAEDSMYEPISTQKDCEMSVSEVEIGCPEYTGVSEIFEQEDFLPNDTSVRTTSEKAEQKVVDEVTLPDYIEDAETEKVSLDFDPYFFPMGYFDNSKFDDAEKVVRHESVQDVDTVHYREVRILWISMMLTGIMDNESSFFSRASDTDGHAILSVYGGLSALEPEFDAKMPVRVTHEGGVEVVYVDPTLLEQKTKATEDIPLVSQPKDAVEQPNEPAYQAGTNVPQKTVTPWMIVLPEDYDRISIRKRKMWTRGSCLGAGPSSDPQGIRHRSTADRNSTYHVYRGDRQEEKRGPNIYIGRRGARYCVEIEGGLEGGRYLGVVY